MFLTTGIFNYFRQILVAFKYFVQSDVLYNHRTKPGTAIQCKTKDSNCHRQNSVRVLSGIRAAQSSVFCVVFIRPLFIIFFLFRLAIALPSRLRFMTSDNSFGIYKQTFLICWPIHTPLYYPHYQIYSIVVYMGCLKKNGSNMWKKCPN